LFFALAVLALAVLAAAGATTGRAATAPTVVTIQFDDGSADQYAALAMLNAHGMHATFYVNTGFVGDATHMTWTQLSDLHAAGNEIGGHTLHHVDLTDKKLSDDDKRHEVCDDRKRLVQQGFATVSFAYPYGAYDQAAQALVKSCGYLSARSAGGVVPDGKSAETVPPVT
jgi:peptidoglycan/xylan/chitin deacetylase (PgdA/CDA1 family)